MSGKSLKERHQEITDSITMKDGNGAAMAAAVAVYIQEIERRLEVLERWAQSVDQAIAEIRRATSPLKCTGGES